MKILQKYQLEKDSIVYIINPYQTNAYNAIVYINGRYPKLGYLTKDIDRYEYLFIIEGQITIILNNKEYVLKTHDSIQIKPNDVYSIKGKATVLVIVKDTSSKAKSKIIKK